jgi:hypothetical protein
MERAARDCALMKMAVALRCVFLVMLLAAAADRIRASFEVEDDRLDTIINALAQQGLVASKHYLQLPKDVRDSVEFVAPGCDRVVRVLPASLSLHELPLLEAIVERDYRRHYIYLGHIWDKPDRFALRMAWLKLRVASGLGRVRYGLPKTMLLVATPPECDVAQKIDWGLVWRQ